ncbi:uncharacterized protein LOC124552395 [Schistocerca americana]|uniref:uncharacterized protein LOC124552395 n=1 Tax=Schistocerca americana TaxID=7009 RepID=UPI001F4FEC52|nr:uncharacterized protein LOC124552395 [Schistocerca americana]
MYRIPVLLLCLLSVTASAGDAGTLTGADSTPDSSNTTHSSSDDLIPCEKNANCEELPDPHICFNGTCYNCYDCCALKKAHCPRRRCYCTWFLTDEELKIVAQAVLGVAVFVTCVALLSLLWKICARRLRRRRVAAAGAGAELLDDAASLSSQQVFVVERLRDRPPRYEEAARDFAVEKPPPYSEAVVEEVQWAPQTARLGGVPGGLTARDFAAPPPYSPPPQRADAVLTANVAAVLMCIPGLNCLVNTEHVFHVSAIRVTSDFVPIYTLGHPDPDILTMTSLYKV